MTECLRPNGAPDAAARQYATETVEAAFAGSHQPTIITEIADGRIRFANQACLDMLGWTRSEFVGKTALEAGVYGAERREQILERLKRDGGARDLEMNLTTKSGETKPAFGSILLLELAGEPCMVGQFHDMSERHRLEVQLSESEERFRQVTESVRQAFVLSSLDPPATLYASPAAERIFGVDLETVYADPLAIRSLIHPEDAGAVGAARSERAHGNLEFRIVRPDGETRWVRASVQPVPPRDGQPALFVSLTEDVTEERALRDELRQSEERFRLLAENSTDVIIRSSPDGTLLYVSPASRVVYGYAPEELVGRSGWELIHPDDLAALRDEAANRGRRPDAVTREYRVRRKDGSSAWIEAKVHALRSPDSGEVVELHASARDITERKEAEAAMRQAMEEAERASNAKSEFLSRVSHELRTPLQAILGFGELLEAEDLNPNQREALGQMTAGGRHLLSLIDEVLDISSIERGELRLSLEPVHVGHVVGETLSLLEPLAVARPVTVLAPPSGDLEFHVLADRQRLKQSLLNLLSNAVKYNREGGEVRLSVAQSDSATARIVVADTGIGIAAEDLATVFAEFERLGADLTGIEGTGLGLAVTKRLIEAMGGEIGAESELGRGSSFWFELPFAAAQEPRPAEPEGDKPRLRPRGPQRTVLYIEDNPSNIKLVRRIVSRRPEVSLIVATAGDAGVELAREHRPVLVILDLNLPGISGEEVLRRIRSDARTAETAVVIVSADATPGQIERLRAAGADDYITKPFEIDQFLTIIDRFDRVDER